MVNTKVNGVMNPTQKGLIMPPEEWLSIVQFKV
jgi:hypothetical protein